MKTIARVAVVAGLALMGNAMAMDMPDLAKQLKCTACHTIDKKRVGPAWKDVAAKYKGATSYTYKGKDYPLKDGLVLKVSNGGGGVWGSMPMAANDPSGSKKADITRLVEFILGLEN